MAKKPDMRRPSTRKRDAPADQAPKQRSPAAIKAAADRAEPAAPVAPVAPAPSDQERIDKGPRYNPDDQSEQLDLQLETLTGDVRDVLMGQIVNMQVGWPFLTEQEQRRRLIQIEAIATTTVRRVMRLMLEDYEFPHLQVAIGEWKVRKPKDGPLIELRCSMPLSEPNGLKLLHHEGANAVLILADHKVFQGERKPFEVAPDQGELLDGHGDDEDGNGNGEDDGDEDDGGKDPAPPPKPAPPPAPAPVA